MQHTTHSVSSAPTPAQPVWRRVSAVSLAGALAATSAVVGIAAPAQATTTAQDVIDVFATGGEVTLTGDVAVTQALSLASDTSVTLDLGGYELSVSGAEGELGGTFPESYQQQIGLSNLGNLIVKNGTLVATGGDGADGLDGADGTAGVPGGDGGDGVSGAPGIFNGSGSRMVLIDVEVNATGGSGGSGGAGGAGGDNADGGAGGNAGDAAQGIFDLGVTLLVDSTEDSNGGEGGSRGAGGPGGIGGNTGADGSPGVSGPARSGYSTPLTLDGNGADRPHHVVAYAQDVGAAIEALDSLPMSWPVRADYVQSGWFTAPNGGANVEEGDFIVGQTIYSQWMPTSQCHAVTFASRLANASDGETVALCGDLTITPSDNPLTVPAHTSVTLDLAGHTLTATGRWQRPAVAVGTDAVLTIEDSAGGGVLDATAGASQAAIELGPRPTTATLIVNSGTVYARATEEYGNGAGIGGSGGDNGGTVVINGGLVHATGTGHSPGIGGSGGNSTVGDNPQPITINGGEVHATGGTGIGGGQETGSGDITINGGVVYATGDGVAIGGGQGSSAVTTVSITGGEVYATSGQGGAAIGSSGSSPGPAITISGGTVQATSNSTGAAIGSGQYSRSTPTITIEGDAHVSATAHGAGAAIGGGYSSQPSNSVEGAGGTININSGTVVAASKAGPDYVWNYGAAIGGGDAGFGADLTIGADAHVTVSSVMESAVGPGTGATDFGSLTNHGTLTVLAGNRVTIPAATTVVNSGSINGAGTINGQGTVNNGGSITDSVTVGNGVTVTDHNFAVTFDAGDGAGAPSDMTVYSETFGGAGLAIGDLPAPTMPGEPFGGWHLTPAAAGIAIDDLTSLSAASSTGTPVPVTLYAGWHNSQHAVNFDSQGGAPMGVAIVAHGATLTSLGEPTRDGFAFTGWFTDADATNPFDVDTPITGDLTLYAGWEQRVFSVNLDSQGGTPMGVAIVDYGDTLDSPGLPERAGFEFAGWFEDAQGTVAFDFATPITADLTLYAAWTELLSPVIVSGPWPQAVVGQPYELLLAATGYPAPTFDVQGLPEGLVFDQANAVISGTPAPPGTFTVTVIARNSIGDTEQQYVLEVAPAASAPDPVPPVDPVPVPDPAPDGDDGTGGSDTVADEATGDLPVTGTPLPVPAIAIALALTILGSVLVLNRGDGRTGMGGV